MIVAVLLAGLIAGQFPSAGALALAAKKSAEHFTLTISGEVPEKFAPTVGRLAALFYECYPKLAARFEDPKKPAPRVIRLIFARDLPYPAFCTGGEIHVNVDWLEKHPGDVGLFTHELTHAVQAYPGGVPSWFTEGLADYARLVYGPKEQPGWSLPKRLTERQSYRDGYRVTGRFLQWLEEKHPGTVDMLHRKAQVGTFDLAEQEVAGGKTVAALWKECVKELDEGK